VDGETWYYLSGDRKHENWSNLVWVQDLAKHTADQVTEFGSSDSMIKRVLVPNARPGTKLDPRQPPVQEFEVTSLDVQTVGKSASVPPLKQDLPPWYLPQALSHLLPRLLPLREPKTFLFAVYVGDTRKVMHRYVDVGTEEIVTLNGQQVRAVPISDRITLEGSPTIHYLDPDSGKYLGSVNKKAKFTILPSSAQELQTIWSNKADLSRPRAQPNPKAHTAAEPQAQQGQEPQQEEPIAPRQRLPQRERANRARQ
jgi:hypothetical protein